MKRWQRAAAPAGGAVTLTIDPVRCQGIGMCAHLAPGVVGLDPWGYPLLPRGPLTGRERAAARSAANGCPHRALHVDETRALHVDETRALHVDETRALHVDDADVR